MMASACPLGRLRRTAALVLGVALAMPACAQTVLVDFGSDGSFRGLSVQNPDSNGNYWTSFTQGTLAEDLIDINNVPTTIDLGLSTNVGQDSYNGPAGATGPADDKNALRTLDLPFVVVDAEALGLLSGADEAVFDFFASPGDPLPNAVRFEIQGLEPTSKYDLTFFGSHSFSNDPTTVYSVYTDNTYTTLVDSASLDVQDPDMPQFHNQDQVAKISNLSPQTDSILYVQFAGSGGGFGYLNALQIEGAAAPGLPGDYNSNSAVENADLTLLLNNWSAPVPPTPAGWLGNPLTAPAVDNDELTALLNNWGAIVGIGSATSQAVPEPTTIVFCVLASVCGVCVRRRA